MKDWNVVEQLVKRAERAGFKAIVVTVDTPRLGRREADIKNRFVLPPHLTLKNFEGLDIGRIDQTNDSGLASYVASQVDRSLNWKDIKWLQTITQLPILLKGVLTAEDALLAMETGAAGIIVSNHGARQLDYVPATIMALEEEGEKKKSDQPENRSGTPDYLLIAALKSKKTHEVASCDLAGRYLGVVSSLPQCQSNEKEEEIVTKSQFTMQSLDLVACHKWQIVKAVQGQIPVFFDGGVCRGTDVFKALALGASGVFIGRPVVFSLAVDGEAGVRNMLQILREEFELTMALSGCRSLGEISRNHVMYKWELPRIAPRL
ncbi:hypothetical protein Cgig2_027259 [Carnegiea gigantea]|uniref:(S)-2-hydroxy-acid oxidase n=1 Tax=Carnegiea gigantea TaxID=171969 RepID=A0A9Q1GUL0_9CARY|nr:hypothetical protein Cgig2_027259 [Carnegiea gigantea]